VEIENSKLEITKSFYTTSLPVQLKHLKGARAKEKETGESMHFQLFAAL
jgi:hypothetical protein